MPSKIGYVSNRNFLLYLLNKVDQAVEEFANRGARAIAVAETDAQGRWVFLGLISLFDPPRDDTKIVIEQAIALGSSVKMITGDHLVCPPFFKELTFCS